MSRMPRPQRPALSRAFIVDRALELIDRMGVEPFSMRKLAVEIGADPMAVYHYFPNKAALFDALVEAIYGEIGAGGIGSKGAPRDAILAVAHAMRAAFLRHARALPLLATRPAATAGMAPLVERFLILIDAAGVPAARGLDMVTTITVFTIGHALAQAAEPVGGASEGGLSALLAEPETYPHLARAAEALAGYDPDRQYRQGIVALVDGLLKPAVG